MGLAKRVEVASARRGRRFGEGRTLELVYEIGLREVILAGPPSRPGLAQGHRMKPRPRTVLG